jgi:protein-S-isoprenylcysteine O-methyltransferase Ste14
MKIVIAVVIGIIALWVLLWLFRTPTGPQSYKLPTWQEPTALCRDGEYSWSQHRSGTCSGHGGVAEWY